MRIIFEEYQYQAKDVKDVLSDISTLQDVDKMVSVNYVGYFYSDKIQDCVFILPKVLLTDNPEWKDDKNLSEEERQKRKPKEYIPTEDQDSPKDQKRDWVRAEDIITPEGQKKHLSEEYRKFIYEFAVWIYRALCVYREDPKVEAKSKALYYKALPQEGRGQRHKANTWLDVLLSIIRFNRENQNFFLFTIKNLHSGHNKINWTRTIAHSPAFVQQGSPIYLDPVNKRRMINFDEELFVIFFSILRYINDNFGFKAPINENYELIPTHVMKNYLDNGMGKRRLLAIKYKYFSDKALELWDLCYAFFDQGHKLSINTDQKEYLLARNFNIVFEAIIDELVGEPHKKIPKGLTDQDDGKRVDHMFTYYGLTHSNDQQDEIYYIGDSKYYKAGHKLGKESIYKQYTYARNVIQWNIDLFMKDQRNLSEKEREQREEDRSTFGKIRLRDDEHDPLTEGYNVIPNFFLSAFVFPDRRYDAGENIRGHQWVPEAKDEQANGKGKFVPTTYISTQFEDRLFDRDTLILSHYDVNFLYVIWLYGRNKASEKQAWKTKVREIFRDEIRKVLTDRFDFYALKSNGNPVAGEEFIRENFKALQGKLYRPYADKFLYSLALEKHPGAETSESDVYRMLSDFFVIEKVELGENPKEKLDDKVEAYQAEHPYEVVPPEWLPEYHLERYLDENFVIGLYHDQKHWDWITGKNDKGSLIYNVRTSSDRPGSMPKSRLKKMKVKFVLLYEEGHLQENRYHVFRVHDTAELSEERMRQTLYPREPKGDYFIFRFDEEVRLGNYDIAQAVAELSTVENAPVFLTGRQLKVYRKI